ncbi:hypothetical protein SKAU_G00217500 [Synaphobranchus kaupii]|uniref:Uncharacterized protein n=1 Tax=Synaphobranchus kaupii TaxID=118154 RepID=A0A9Q1IVP5_SYNKA|nr:hypothetical protein SKAU_G00217500 [Synaphobranchus kaupii]
MYLLTKATGKSHFQYGNLSDCLGIRCAVSSCRIPLMRTRMPDNQFSGRQLTGISQQSCLMSIKHLHVELPRTVSS